MMGRRDEFSYMWPGTFGGRVMISDEILIFVFSFFGQVCQWYDGDDVH